MASTVQNPKSESLSEREAIFRLLTLRSARLSGLFPAPGESFFRYVALNNFDDKSSKSHKLFETTILRDELPLTTATRLNDPFDVNPTFVNDLLDAEALSWLEHNDIQVDVNGRRERFNPTRHKVHGPDTVLTDAELSQHVTKILKDGLIKKLRQDGLASFSKTITSQLMWAHYSEGFQGIAYHFIVGRDPTSVITRLQRMSYVSQRPLVPLSSVLQFLSRSETTGHEKALTPDLDFLDTIFLFKSTEWAHEQEYRIVRFGDSTAHFNANELASIIIGPNFREEWIPILQEVNLNRQHPLKLFRAHLSPSNYSIEVDWGRAL